MIDNGSGFRQTGEMLSRFKATRKNRWLSIFVITACVLVMMARANAASEIVVAIRYFQAQGESHAHLFLYREDGTLLRQLTKDNSGQDLDPIFAPDGETIVFTREISENKLEFWSVEPKSAAARRLDAAPEWYSAAKSSPYFAWPEMEGSGDDENSTPFGQRSPHFRAPDGSVELVLREVKGDEADLETVPATESTISCAI
ncbi:MAG TPA: hypothetical protein VK581_00785 [Chthoniobacterales bacterium]|nr:hypothetical protein [Chthoniobacterales bacterium]